MPVLVRMGHSNASYLFHIDQCSRKRLYRTPYINFIDALRFIAFNTCRCFRSFIAVSCMNAPYDICLACSVAPRKVCTKWKDPLDLWPLGRMKREGEIYV